MTIDPSKVTRFDHGSRVPGWDDPVDLTKAPAEVPDPATTPVPDAMRAEIDVHMRRGLDTTERFLRDGGPAEAATGD